MAILALPTGSPAQTTHRMIVNADQGTTVINKHIYGHFAEHLGRGIYDGFWRRGQDGEWALRPDIVQALRQINIPNLRWPGGCFADYYHWRDGVGPRDARPTIVNNLWGGVTEDNSFGTHEFMSLVDALETEPIVVGNVGSGTVQEMSQWWEYMNHPGVSPMADMRRGNGRDEPWNVRYWGVGNESWGCGGNMTPAYYADVYKRFATYLHSYGSTRPFRIATGAPGGDVNWTEEVMREAGSMIDGIDVHHYTLVGTWAQKGHATDFPEAEWMELLQKSLDVDGIIAGHRAVLDRYDPENRVWLIIGEWGTWHEREEGSTPGFLAQQNTLRDALAASLSLNIFNKHAERVRMANIAQTINVLQAMILTRDDAMVLTPTYHVFDFYKVHHDATRLPFTLDAGAYTHGDESIPALHATASRDESGTIHLTVTNVDPESEKMLEVSVRGGEITSATARVLTADAINAHNTFEAPNRVAPRPAGGVVVDGQRVTIRVPSKSLLVVTIR